MKKKYEVVKNSFGYGKEVVKKNISKKKAQKLSKECNFIKCINEMTFEFYVRKMKSKKK